MFPFRTPQGPEAEAYHLSLLAERQIPLAYKSILEFPSPIRVGAIVAASAKSAPWQKVESIQRYNGRNAAASLIDLGYFVVDTSGRAGHGGGDVSEIVSQGNTLMVVTPWPSNNEIADICEQYLAAEAAKGGEFVMRQFLQTLGYTRVVVHVTGRGNFMLTRDSLKAAARRLATTTLSTSQ